MRSITAVLMLVLMLLPFSVTSVPTNVHMVPTCLTDLNHLPIFQLRAWANSESKVVDVSTVFLIGKNRWATSSHSVGYGNSKIIQIELNDGKKIPGKLILNDKAGDIAVIEADSGSIEPIKIHQKIIKKFQPTWNIGYPAIDRPYLHSYHGMALHYNSRGFIVTSSLGLKGMSGGINVICHNGEAEVIGVISAHDTATISETVWTDIETGTLHIRRTALNAGTTWIAPIDLLLLKEDGAPILEWILNE